MKTIRWAGLFLFLVATSAALAFGRYRGSETPKSAPGAGKQSETTRPWEITMLTASGEDHNLIQGGKGVVPVHFKATHRSKIPGAFRLVAYVTALNDPDTVLTEHQFADYTMNVGEEKRDEFACLLEVPRGEYWLNVELRDLRRVVDRSGNLLAEYHGQGNRVYRATVR